MALEGRFLSLPGSLWYEFSRPGFYAGAVVMGVLIGLVPAVLTSSRCGGIGIDIAMTLLLTALLAPLLMAVDIICVPYMIIGFGLVDVVHRALGGGVHRSGHLRLQTSAICRPGAGEFLQFLVDSIASARRNGPQ